MAERLVDSAREADPEAMPNEPMRSLVLRRSLEGVAHMTRGEAHHLATLAEAIFAG